MYGFIVNSNHSIFLLKLDKIIKKPLVYIILMNILLINPNPSLGTNMNPKLSYIDRMKGRIMMFSAPLAFPMLAAVTPKNHNIRMIDETYQKIVFNINCDLVGITVMTPSASRAYEIADEFRKKNITVVLGGNHTTILPEEAKQHADCVVVGEAEEIWPQLLVDFEEKKLKPFYYQTKPVNLNKAPMPCRDIVKRTFIATGVQSSRGCPNRCKYCFYSNALHGKIYRKRPITQVVEEIKGISQKLILFHDASFTIDINYTKELFRALKGLNKRYICLGNVDVLSRDDELLKLSKEAGCVQWHIGFESVSQEALEQIGKRTNNVENYLKAVEKIHKHGMNVHGFFMFGFDKEPPSIFDDTLKFLKKAKLDSADFSIVVPYPGTRLYDELLAENRILTDDWSQYAFRKDIVFKPINKTQEEIFKNVSRVVRSYHSCPFIARRVLYLFKRRLSAYRILFFIIENVFSRKYYIDMFKI